MDPVARTAALDDLAGSLRERLVARAGEEDGPDAQAGIRALVERGIDITEARWVGTDLESIFFTETGSVQAVEDDHAR